jgi:hypothetical protein
MSDLEIHFGWNRDDEEIRGRSRGAMQKEQGRGIRSRRRTWKRRGRKRRRRNNKRQRKQRREEGGWIRKEEENGEGEGVPLSSVTACEKGIAASYKGPI